MNTNAVRSPRKDRPSSLAPRDPVSAPGLLEHWGYRCVCIKVCVYGEGVHMWGVRTVCACVLAKNCKWGGACVHLGVCTWGVCARKGVFMRGECRGVYVGGNLARLD